MIIDVALSGTMPSMALHPMLLKIATYLGIMTAFGAFTFNSFIIFKTIIFRDSFAGFTSFIAMITFLGGAQLVTIGIIDEYLGRRFFFSPRLKQ